MTLHTKSVKHVTALAVTLWSQKKREVPETASHLPARSDLDVNSSFTIPEDDDIILWEVDDCEVSSWPDEHSLLPVNHTGGILNNKKFDFTEMFPH